MKDEEYGETSESGSPIYRYEMHDRSLQDFVPPDQDEEALSRIDQHLERYLDYGDNGWVFHELISDIVHVDVHIIPPTDSRNYFVLVTSGMSDRPMNTPPEAKHLSYAELLMCLPPSWPLAIQRADLLSDEEKYWPIRTLKFLARFPHEYNTWFGPGHTIPNGDPPAPLAENTKLCCVLLVRPILFGEDFAQLEVNDDKTVSFLSLIPIYKEEMDFKLKRGTSALLERFRENGITELLDLERKNVCKSLFGLF
jgi:hypothetical protein